MTANDTLTVGDVLAGSLQRQIQRLPNDEQAARAERALDAMMAASAAELDALRNELDADLQRAARNTTLTLSVELRRVEERYEGVLNRTASALDARRPPLQPLIQVVGALLFANAILNAMAGGLLKRRKLIVQG